MDPDVTTFAQVSVVIVALVGSLSIIGVVAVRTLTKTFRRPQLPRFDDQQLVQLQQSVDAIALEVERIAEAQRFTAKLMVEREATPKLSP